MNAKIPASSQIRAIGAIRGNQSSMKHGKLTGEILGAAMAEGPGPKGTTDFRI